MNTTTYISGISEELADALSQTITSLLPDEQILKMIEAVDNDTLRDYLIHELESIKLVPGTYKPMPVRLPPPRYITNSQNQFDINLAVESNTDYDNLLNALVNNLVVQVHITPAGMAEINIQSIHPVYKVQQIESEDVYIPENVDNNLPGNETFYGLRLKLKTSGLNENNSTTIPNTHWAFLYTWPEAWENGPNTIYEAISNYHYKLLAFHLY
jgi:hypothetical protein